MPQKGDLCDIENAVIYDTSDESSDGSISIEPDSGEIKPHQRMTKLWSEEELCNGFGIVRVDVVIEGRDVVIYCCVFAIVYLCDTMS